MVQGGNIGDSDAGRKKLRRAALAALMMTSSVAVVGMAVPAHAQEATRNFDIPAQPLATALTAFGQQSGLQVSAQAALVEGRTSTTVRGAMAPLSALSQLLVGTGLSFRIVGSTVTLEPAPRATGNDGAVQLGPVRVEGAGASTGLTGPGSSDMLVSEGTRSYTARGAATASKLPLTLRETPQSVSVITQQQIEDRNFINIETAVEAQTGISGTTGNIGEVSFQARGFSMGSPQIDGMTSAGAALGVYSPSMAMFDRVEIVRGSAGLTSGQGSAGGAVNLVRKRPFAEPRFAGVLHAGTWNQYRAEADVSMPVTDWLRVRGVAAYENRKYFVDLQHTKRPLLYGIVEIDATPTTILTAGASYEEVNTDHFVHAGLPWFADGRDPHLPRSSRSILPGWDFHNFRAINAFGGIEQRLGGTWKAKFSANQQWWKRDYVAPNAVPPGGGRGGEIDPVTLIGPRLGNSVENNVQFFRNFSMDGQVSGEIEAFGRPHEVVLGASYSEERALRTLTASARITPVVQPIFDADPWAIAPPVFGAYSSTGRYSKTSQTGIYGVARLNIAEPLKLIVGARLSWHEARSRTSATAALSEGKQSGVFTPYGGIVLDVSSNWTVYASYSDIFRVQNTQYQADGSPLPPVIGSNYEVGVKGEFLDGKLNTSFALFRVLETNRSQVDPDNPSPCAGSPSGGACYIAEGKVRGQGFETEISGELFPRLQVIAGYTYLDSKYIRDRTASGAPSTNEGLRFGTVTPKHMLRIWGSYDLPGALDGLSIGAGITLQSKIYNISGIYTIEQKGYALANARLGYKFNEHISLALNANNVFDKRYYQRVGSLSNGNRYGEPRSILLSARITY